MGDRPPSQTGLTKQHMAPVKLPTVYIFEPSMNDA